MTVDPGSFEHFRRGEPVGTQASHAYPGRRDQTRRSEPTRAFTYGPGTPTYVFAGPKQVGG